jgi:hypothetical protein
MGSVLVKSDEGGAGLPRLGRWELGQRLGGFVYGTILVLTVVVTGAKAFPHAPGHLALLVAMTTVVFWLAHVYADGLAFSVDHDTRPSLAELGRISRREAAILGAGVPPEVALVFGAVGLLSESVAVWLALGLGLVVLGTTGVVLGRVERLGRLRTLVAILANLTLGVALIGLKVLVVH